MMYVHDISLKVQVIDNNLLHLNGEPTNAH